MNTLWRKAIRDFWHERARTALNIPAGFSVEAMAAVGKPADISVLPESLRERETPSDRRKLDQTVCEGPFCFE